MLGIDWRAARATWTVFLFVLVLAMLYFARQAILLVVAAFFFAYILAPLLDTICQITPRKISRTTALAAVYVLLLTTVGLLTTWLGGQVVEEAALLAERLPALIEKHKDLTSLPLPTWLEPARVRLVEAIRSQMDQGFGRLLPLVQRTVGGVMGVVGSLMFLIIVPIFTFLFLKDADLIRESLLTWIPRNRRAFLDDVMQDTHVMLAQYIRALVILSVMTSIVYLAFFSIIGLPYAVLVSLLAAPLEFIPFFGPLSGTVLILLIALFTGFPHFWWIVIFFVAYRMFQDYVLQPYLMSSGAQLHPLLVLFGALAGEQLGGLWGMFLSVPVLAILRIVFIRTRRRQQMAV
jgi:predicted PurR-regulated permease PerM